MRKFAIGTVQSFFKAYLYTIAALFIGTFAPFFIVFGMAFGRMGGFNKYLAYIAVGFLVGMVTTLVSGLIASFTGFLPGILGQIVGWGVLGAVITFLVSIVLKAFGARK